MPCFSQRILSSRKSFIREILKVAADPEIISFAGGLPNKKYFPVDGLKKATEAVFREESETALQYSASEGCPQLRRWIADRYRTRDGLEIDPDSLLITSGSQQALDLLGKVFLNPGDSLLMEKPGYLGAIQAFSMFEPQIHQIRQNPDGIDIPELKSAVKKDRPKLLYTVPEFQNPSGISYTEKIKQQTAEVIRNSDCYLIEDNPYGDLRFSGNPAPSFRAYLPERSILLGTFSKTVVPSFRLGWVVAPKEIREKLIIAKQAADLHTNFFIQRVVARYLQNNDIEEHLGQIREVYGRQCRTMQSAIAEYFPSSIEVTRPEGGMFLWAELPEGDSSMELFHRAIEKKVAFVPGNPFYTDGTGNHTFRLNFSCTEEPVIEEGIRRLASVL